MGSPTSMFLNLIFSSLGVGYFIYGKKQREGMPLLSGIALMVFPYFVTNVYAIIFVGIVLLVLPRFIEF